MKYVFSLIFVFLACSLFSGESGASKRVIQVNTQENCLGEKEFSQRIIKAGENINWEVEIVDLDDNCHDPKPCDWRLNLMPRSGYTPGSEDYLVLFDPVYHFYSPDGHLCGNFRHYAGYLTIYDNIEGLAKDVKGRIYPKRWYPTVQYRPYNEVKPDKLMFLLCCWGSRLWDKQQKILLRKLAKTGYAFFYGSPKVGKPYGSAFQGKIAFDGETLLDCIADHGVCLVLHSDVHLEYGIPSGRIFEAAAASAVIISDLNQFVIEHFGDSVFYLDQNQSGRKMFAKVDEIMQWIKQHPEEALLMAQKAHQIFEDNFLLEDQLLEFERFQSEGFYN